MEVRFVVDGKTYSTFLDSTYTGMLRNYTTHVESKPILKFKTWQEAVGKKFLHLLFSASWQTNVPATSR